MYTDEASVNFLKDDVVKAKLANAKKLSDVNVEDYEAIFYVGGQGPVIDLPFDPVNIELASKVSWGCRGDLVDLIIWPVLSSGKNHLCCVSWACVSAEHNSLQND